MTYVDMVAALLSNMGDGTHRPWCNHDLVRVDERILVHGSVDITTRDVIAELQ